MKITWKDCDFSYVDDIEDSMDYIDRTMMCMEKTTWHETAIAIENELINCKNGQFRNVVGLINGKPAVFAMFGVECSGECLRIYNLFVPHEFRRKGIGRQAVNDILDEKNIFNLDKTYNRLATSIFSNNDASFDLFTGMDMYLTGCEDGLVGLERNL